MSLNWNPTTPTKVGVEHDDAGVQHQQIDDFAKQRGLRFRAKHTGAIQAFELHAGVGASAPLLDSRYGELPRPMFIDLVAAGNEASSVVSQTQVAPSAVSSSANMFSETLGTPLLSDILTPDDGNFMVASALNAYTDIAFDTAAFPLTEQILRVGLRIDTNATFRLSRIDPTGTIRWYKDIPALGASPYPNWVYQGDAKVDAGASVWSWWTPQDIRDLRNSGGTRRFRVQCKAGPGVWKLDYVRMYIIHVTERRIGAGIGSPTTPQQWFQFDMKTPAGTGDPSVTNTNLYTAIVRRALVTSTDSTMSHAVLPWRHLKGSLQPAETHDTYVINTSVPPDVDNSPIFLSGNIKTDGLGDLVEGVATARIVSGGICTDETQPYEWMRGALVYDGFDAVQEISIPAGTSVYGQVMAIVGRKNLIDSGPLHVEVTDAADVPVLLDKTYTVADWDRQPDLVNGLDDQGYRYKLIRIRFDQSVDLPTAAHKIKFTSDADSASQWRVGALIASDHGATDRTYGGAVDEAIGSWVKSSVAVGRALTQDTIETLQGGYTSDLMAVLATVPPAVTNFTAELGVITAHHTNVGGECNTGAEGCVDHGSPFARLAWDIAPDTSATYYEIQRRTDYRPDWVYVATVQGRPTLEWDDHELPIGVTTDYRIRSVRADMIAGEWSDIASITIPRGYIALSFTSNAATGMSCTYNEAYEGRLVTKEFDFQESEDITYRAMYGENGMRAFRPLERRGVTFQRALLLSGLATVASPSLSLADPLRLLAWAQLPYVCVRDDEGNVTYASVEVGSVENTRSSTTTLWFVRIRVVETAGPYAVDTGVAQVTPGDVGI